MGMSVGNMNACWQKDINQPSDETGHEHLVSVDSREEVYGKLWGSYSSPKTNVNRGLLFSVCTLRVTRAWSGCINKGGEVVHGFVGARGKQELGRR